jgi:hypothetical protein
MELATDDLIDLFGRPVGSEGFPLGFDEGINFASHGRIVLGVFR